MQSEFEKLSTSPVSVPETNKIEDSKIESSSNSIEGWEILFSPHPDIFFSGNDPLHFFQALEEWGPLRVTLNIDHLPPFNELNPENCFLSWKLILETNISKQIIEEIFEWVADISQLELKPISRLLVKKFSSPPGKME
ncbi:MAG: hypothetical protein H0U71_02595 [Gammaproteobacteria bacterium]|nr:hypothetical protein [Gammaproteobacteria bacterium]